MCNSIEELSIDRIYLTRLPTAPKGLPAELLFIPFCISVNTVPKYN